jgi:putative CRISPR-associated protein (TIGR02619 family)
VTTAIVSTCGTSLLTNGADAETRRLITACANHSESQLEPGEREALDAWLANRREAIAEADAAAVRRLSAELNGLLAWYGDEWPHRSHQEVHFLLHTDTYLGAHAAGLVATWMERQGLGVHPTMIEGLNTADAEGFAAAMSDLARWCYNTFDAGGYDRVIFNLVGGFKSLQGFMQALGMFYADECVYIFETGQALLRIPRLPIRLDAADILREHASAFLRLEVWGQARADQCEGIPETLLLSMDDDRVLSGWGQLLWDKSREAILGAELLEPLSERLRWGPELASGAAGLQSDLRIRLNRQLARLARCVEGGGEKGDHNPGSLDFKQLRAEYKGATHECDAFAGHDPRRLFGHFEGPVFVVDELRKHL